MPNYIKPNRKNVPAPKISNSQADSFTMSYRIKGMMMGFAATGLYNYWYWDQWYPLFLLGGIVAGYILGWIIGSFFYTPK